MDDESTQSKTHVMDIKHSSLHDNILFYLLDGIEMNTFAILFQYQFINVA